ncbi:MAG: DUF3592 domain-containing protein [Anaerolineae bacterium]
MDDNTFSALILVYIIWTAFLGWIVYQQYLAWRWGRASQNWPQTTGRVAVSGTTIASSRRRLKLGVKVIYAYVVDGVTYNASRIRFGNRWFVTDNDARRIAAHYKPDKTVKVFHHPENPRLAVLQPGIDDLIQTIEAIGVVLAMLFWLWWTWIILRSL